MIEVEGLTKYYGDRPGVSDVSFRIAAGETVGLLGPNGAGKTTIMKMLACHMLPSSGTITINGIDAIESPQEAARHIGYMPEVPPLYTDMDVYGYLAFIAGLKGVPPRGRAAHLAEVMDLVAVTGVKDRLIRNLSKGYRQRVGLGQALVGFPDVLVLDEPTVGLDPKQIAEVRQLIGKLGRDHTVLLSSHILPEIKTTCQRIIIVSGGRVVLQDTVEHLEEGGGSFSIRIRGDAGRACEILASTPGVSGVELRDGAAAHGAAGGYCRFIVTGQVDTTVREAIFRRLAAADMPIVELRPAGNTLEEVFLESTSLPAAGSAED